MVILASVLLLAGLLLPGLFPAVTIIIFVVLYWASVLGTLDVTSVVLFICCLSTIPLSAYCAGSIADAALHHNFRQSPLASFAVFLALAQSASPELIMNFFAACTEVVADQTPGGALLVSLNLANSVLLTAGIAVSILLLLVALFELPFLLILRARKVPVAIHLPVVRQLGFLLFVALGLQLLLDFFSSELWPEAELLNTPLSSSLAQAFL